MKIQPITNVTDPSNLRITINQVIRQVSDSTGRITLSNGTTTTVNNSKVVPDSVIILQSRNAAATDAKAFISDISTGVFVVTHIAGTDRVFDYVIIGSI